MPAPLIFRLNQQALGYGKQTVLELDSLEVHQGEKIALLGVSGSGKSTLLDSLYHQAADQCAYCPQQLGLVSILSVFHNIYMGRLQQHSSFYNLLNLIKPQSKPLAEITALGNLVGLSDKLRTSVDQLSGGQRQRTALARAFYQQAPIFLGDEPVSAVDDLQASQLLSAINEHHSTVLVALHDRNLALQHFDRIIGLKQGRILLDSDTRSLNSEDLAVIYGV